MSRELQNTLSKYLYYQLHLGFKKDAYFIFIILYSFEFLLGVPIYFGVW